MNASLRSLKAIPTFVARGRVGRGSLRRVADRLGWLAVAALALLAPTAACAGQAIGDIGTGPASAPATGGSATQALFAYAQQTDLPRPANASTSDLYFNGTVSTGPAGPAPGPTGVNIVFSTPALGGLVAITETYGPAVGYGGVTARPKPTIPPAPAGTTKEVLTSVSGAAVADASYALPTAANPGGVVSAKAQFAVFTPTSKAGRAAAAAFDPITVSPGTYSNYQYHINASLQSDPGGYSALQFFALDSRLTNPATSDGVDNFYDHGQPMGDTLWSLTILADGPLTSKSNLYVDFMINPAARATPPGGGPPILDPSLTDQQISNLIKNAFTISGGTATLTDYSIFPSNTLYDIPTDAGDIRYGDGVNAFTAVPEPSTLILAGIACMVFVANRAMKRQGEGVERGDP